MATPMSYITFLAALQAEGARVVEVGAWRTNNRNHKGPWGPVHGVMIHHTVTSGAAKTVALCQSGHSTLPGPLCHGVITKDGRVHLVGYGRANHAGLGDPDVLQAVIAERALPLDDEATTDGNRHFYGFECENLGDGQDPWPSAQILAIEQVAAAICRHHGWGAESVIRHLDWQPGKIDPLGPGMDWRLVRARVAARLEKKAPAVLRRLRRRPSASPSCARPRCPTRSGRGRRSPTGVWSRSRPRSSTTGAWPAATATATGAPRPRPATPGGSARRPAAATAATTPTDCPAVTP